jgi:hypothetical protein
LGVEKSSNPRKSFSLNITASFLIFGNIYKPRLT